MSGPAHLAIWTGVILDAGLKAGPLLACGWAGVTCLRRSTAANRHAVWALTLGALPLVVIQSAARGPGIAVDHPVIAAIWAIGVLIACAPLLLGGWRLIHLPWTPTGTHDGVRLGTSEAVDGPMTWGWLHPVVVFPPGLPSDHRRAALAHELGHVRRGDWLVHVLTWFVFAVFWFHPLVWLAWRQLGIEAEHAADDEALAHGVPPSTLAASLLAVATRSRRVVALHAGTSSTSRRIHAILEARPRQPSRGPVGVAALVALTLALPALAAWHPWNAPPEALTCHPESPRLP